MKTEKVNQAVRKMKKWIHAGIQGIKKKTVWIATLAGAGVLFLPQIGFAANEDFDPIEGMSRLTELVLMLITGVGIFFLAFGVINLALSFQSHDESQKSRGIMGIVGGLIAVGLRVLLQFIGVSI